VTLANNTGDARRLQLLIDAVIDYALYMVSLDGRVLSWNSGAIRLKGYEAEEIIGQSFARFFTQKDQADGLPQRALANAAKNGKFETEGWRVRKDGSQFWGLAVLDAIKDETDEVIGFVMITRDLTEQMQSHRELLESEKRYRRLIESVVDYAIFQLDAEGHISTWNPGAERIKGYKAEEIIGQHFSRFYTPKDREAGIPGEALRKAAEEGKYEAEGIRVRKDGEEFSAFVVIDPIYDEAGGLIGFAKVTRDITSRVNTERTLRETQERLAMAQKMEAVGQLSGGIAHDFNNLLMIVLGNLETAQRHAKETGHSNLQRSIQHATRGAQRAAALTSRLLAFSRRQALDPKPTDINKFLNSVVEFLQRTLGENIEIEAVGAGGLWDVEVDTNHLETALLNLAINARDAMPGGGKLTIEAANTYLDEAYALANPEASPGRFVMIAVSDTGHGMAPDVLSRAFEPFFTTKDIGQGTGLGLSQVYGFVKQSGGHIKIYSEEGEGTVIKIYLPRLPKRDRGDDEQLAEASLGEGEEGETILVVEDDEDLRDYLCGMLREWNYRVLSAADGEGALKLLKQHGRIDLLLTDVVMRGLNGRELAKAAQLLRPDLRVLYMTGYSRNAVVHHGRLDEGVELLQKPISQNQLSERVRDMLDR
jgi:PAS domain S-box-containing protein